MADDLGYGDLSCFGQTKFTTPNIDRFAQESGAYFDNDGGTFADPHPAALKSEHAADVMKAIQDTIRHYG